VGPETGGRCTTRNQAVFAEPKHDWNAMGTASQAEGYEDGRTRHESKTMGELETEDPVAANEPRQTAEGRQLRAVTFSSTDSARIWKSVESCFAQLVFVTNCFQELMY
jgi:hypothetical protein